MRRAWILLLLASCSHTSHYHLYATDFDPAEGDRFLVWPAAADGSSFQYMHEDDSRERRVHALSAVLPMEFDAKTASVVVIQPRSGSESLRSAIERILKQIRTACPNAGIHLVQDGFDWTSVKNPRAAALRLLELKDEAKNRRPANDWIYRSMYTDPIMWGVFSTQVGNIGSNEFLALGSAIWVVPDKSDPLRYWTVAQPLNTAAAGRPLQWKTLSIPEITTFLQSQEPLTVTHPSTMSTREFAKTYAKSKYLKNSERRAYVHVAILLPRDVPNAHESVARLSVLLQQPAVALNVLRIDDDFESIFEAVSKNETPFPPPPGLLPYID